MSNQAQEYRPHFPKSHALLLEMYTRLMAARGEKEVAVWADRFKGLIKTFEAMKEDGAVPMHFVENFRFDVEDVMARVHHRLDTRRLTQTQSELTVGIANLATLFGHR